MRTLALALAGMLGGSFPVLAQPPLPTFTETLQVTASLQEKPAVEIAATVSVVGHDEVDARQATSVLELLATLPGLSLTQSGSAGKSASLFSRGTSSNHTLVLWDGVRLNDPFLGGFDWAFLAPEGLRRVESVRGPFSALYGSGAVGGVVQLVTRRDPGLSARVEGGSRDYLRGAFAWGSEVGPFFATAHGNVRRGEGAVDNDFFDAEETAARFDSRGEGSWRFGLAARWQHAEVGLPYDFLGQVSPHQRQDGTTRQLAVPFAWQGTSSGLEGNLARVEQDLAVDDADNPFAASSSDASSDQARLVAHRAFGPHWSFALGGDWERQAATSASAFGPGLEDQSQRSTAAFAQITRSGERTRLEAGVRRDDNDAFGGATSFRGGAVVRLSERTVLRGSYGEAFRAPSLADLYYPGFGNPSLQPERSQGFELGVESGRGPWRVAATAFETRLSDLVQYDFLAGKPFNTGRARTRGVEGELRFRQTAYWLRASATYLEALDLESGDRLLRRPRLSSALVAGGSVGDLDLHATVRQVGSRLDVGGVELDSYVVAEAGATWRGASRLSPYLRVSNLFDASYEEAAGYPAPSRTWVAGLSLAWGR